MPAVRAPDPSNERARLATLRGDAILDIEPGPGIDDLVAAKGIEVVVETGPVHSEVDPQQLLARVQAIPGRR